MDDQARQTVWALYENHPSQCSKLLGIFSTLDCAKNCALIQPLLRENWQYYDLGEGVVLWRAAAIDLNHNQQEIFHFTIEEIQVDHLVE
jgi:hypothetical protein